MPEADHNTHEVEYAGQKEVEENYEGADDDQQDDDQGNGEKEKEQDGDTAA